jgi:hypothetical protein
MEVFALLLIGFAAVIYTGVRFLQAARAYKAALDHDDCEVCGQAWITHNDDGSCVVD